uniref:FAD-dependent oxidoreductase n=1 Tax=Echinostoma caproni TaxID=27848 RepID=A0A183APY5_9TREM
LTVAEACRIIEEDALYTFTKVDLCLNSRLADRLTANSTPVVFDPSELFVDWPSGGTDGGKDIRILVDELVKHLSAEGWVYPSSEPIGGHVAYRFLNGGNRLEDAVLSTIRNINDRNPAGNGADARTILSLIRLSKLGDWCRLSFPALRRILDRLEGNSRIYQVQPSVYKTA